MLSRHTKLNKLKRLQEARKTGKIVLLDEEDAAIYDEVDEDTFRQHKRKQLLSDDFIVDDNGEGYVDNGADEWDDSTRPNYSSDEEAPEAGSKRLKPAKKVAKVAKTPDINSFFGAGAAPRKLEPKPALSHSIDDILDDFGGAQPIKRRKATPKRVAKSSPFEFLTATSSRPRKRDPTKEKGSVAPESFATLQSELMDIDTGGSNAANVPGSDSDTQPIGSPGDSLPMGRPEDVDGQPEGLTEGPLASPAQSQESDSGSDDELVVRRRRPAAAPVTDVNVSAVKALNLPHKAREAHKSGEEPARAPLKLETLAQPSEVPAKRSNLEVSEFAENDRFRMYWFDYAEVDKSLLLFGKVLLKAGTYESAVVQVNGLCRELYALPRPTRVVEGQETDTMVALKDVHEELAPLLMDHYGLQQLRAKPQRMKYAFELAGIPKEAEYLKVLLPFKTPKNLHVVMPSEVEGETFLRIFGTNNLMFESFVMQQNIMGPCWLEISHADFSSLKNVSHCQIEASVAAAAHVTPILNDPSLVPPPLNAVVLSVQAVMNPAQNKQEIACVSVAVYPNVAQDSPVDENTAPNEVFTLIRPVAGPAFPPGLRQLAEKQKIQLVTLPNETSLLQCLAAKLKTIDPDILFGHRLENIALDVLVHRMYDLKVPLWSALGRRNRKAWPDRFGRGSGFNSNLVIREIFLGRLLCDIANELGQSLTPKCQSWDLAEMYSVVCHKAHPSAEINLAHRKYAADASFLMMPIKENIMQVRMTAQIAFAVQIMSLSKQLTNLAGNAWAHTLSGTRAGRNEYILLHEFKKNQYILPDKEDRFHKNQALHEAKVEATDDDATTVTSNKKPKYQGGLVFEPEKGLHKNYILVMDFNSLYPSIIQEYNICFTTVDRSAYNTTHDDDRDLPEIPERDTAAGVLPRLLNTLVTRRREVKKLMKAPGLSAGERAQCDIKQQALKLTANSMYGCLGYVNSRFYAKPLAMLVTNKGREILMDTRQLAELMGLRVVYGDTDSVMIDSGVTSLAEALKIGDDFKLKVNERYKLLEIDTDNVFKRLLLHAKKKYAAMTTTVDALGKERLQLEVKGLDMRRREYCPLSKEMSTEILHMLLSDKDPEDALKEVYDYLEKMNHKIRNNDFSVDKYQINTRLSKDPSSYPHGKTMPPVQVALRLRKQGEVIKAGSVVTFAIGKRQEGAADDDELPAQRARSMREILSDKTTKFEPDADYYLEKQIYAPVERLVGKIEGIDLMRVAKSLGLDARKYATRLRHHEAEIEPLESNISDVERFRQASFLAVACACGAAFRFGGLVASPDYKITSNGVQCGGCQRGMPVHTLAAQVETEIRRHLAVYYAGWLVCDDSACGIQTRHISVYGKRCIGALGKAHGCKGVMRYKYSDKALYNQLLYFEAVFDVDKAKAGQLRPVHDKVPDMSHGEVHALAEQNRAYFDTCKAIVEVYLQDCGRRYVNMKTIFDFMV